MPEKKVDKIAQRYYEGKKENWKSTALRIPNPPLAAERIDWDQAEELILMLVTDWRELQNISETSLKVQKPSNIEKQAVDRGVENKIISVQLYVTLFRLFSVYL